MLDTRKPPIEQLWITLKPLLAKQHPNLEKEFGSLDTEFQSTNLDRLELAASRLNGMLTGATLAPKADSCDDDLEAAMLSQRRRIEANGRR